MPTDPRDLHDAMLLIAPEGSRHDQALCLFCTDWSMSEDGTPSGLGRLDLADAKQPYGDVEYADPGYQPDKVKRYPIDTEAHARAAWSYIHQASNADKYSADQLSQIRIRIAAALKKFGVETQDNEVEHERRMAEAKNAGKPAPKASGGSKKKSDAASEGGTNSMDDQEMISKETHEALLEKSLRDSTETLASEKASLEAKVNELTEATSTKDAEIASLRTENERLNGELDTAQVALKAAQDETAALKADIAAKEEEAAKAEIASARAAQVRNLGLFNEEHVADKASRWAELGEEEWAERLEEWKTLKGSTSSTQASAPTTDTASAMTGTTEATGKPVSVRRAVLGLN